MQEVLVDADELTAEHVVQRLENLLAPLHATSPAVARLAQHRRGNQEGSGGGPSGVRLLAGRVEVALDVRQARAAVAARAVATAGDVFQSAGAAAHRLDDFTIGNTATDAEDHRTGPFLEPAPDPT